MNAPAHNLLEVRKLCKTYSQGPWWRKQFQVQALKDVDLTVKSGQTLALVGASGSGKTTLAMCLIGLESADSGTIRFDGLNLLESGNKKQVASVRNMQLIFQDSAGALSPRMSALEIVEEPLLVRGLGGKKDRESQALAAMELVGISPNRRNRRPHEFSGGQRQRLAIARALVTRPKLLILDEPLAGLDISIRGQVTNLLLDLQAAHDLSYLFISHDTEVVSCIAHEVAVMRDGTVEQMTTSGWLRLHGRSASIPVPSAYGAAMGSYGSL